MVSLDRFTHPRLVALALVGGGWWVGGLLFLLFGPSRIQGLSVLVHLAGLVLVAVAAVLFGIFWWADTIRTRLHR